MAIQLGSAAGIVTLDTSGVATGVQSAIGNIDTLKTNLQGIGGSMMAVGGMMSAAITLPVSLATKSAISDAEDMQNAMGKNKTVFGDNAGAVVDWAKTVTDQFGLSKQEAINGADTFGQMFNTMGVGINTSEQMSTKLVGLASDMAAFKGVDPTEMLNELQAGLVGRGMDLKKFGIDLSATKVNAEALALGFKPVNGVFTDAQLVQARYAIILQDTDKIQGYYASHTGDASEAQNNLNKAWTDALGTVGTDLLPIFVKLVQVLTSILEKFQTLPGWVRGAIEIFIGLVAVIGPILVVFGSLAMFIVSIMSLVTALGPVFGAVGTAIGALGGIFTETIIPAIMGIGDAIFGTAIPAFIALAASTIEIWGPILLIIGAVALLYWAFKTNFMGITTTVQQLWSIIKYYFSMIVNYIGGIINQAGSWGYNLIMGMVNGIKSAVGSLVAAAKNAADSAMNAIKNALGIHSPSTVMFQIGMNTGLGFLQGLEQSMNANAIAGSMMRPMQNVSTSSQMFAVNVAGGLQMHQVRSAISQNNEQILQTMVQMLRGAG